jgi:hypothetical protein
MDAERISLQGLLERVGLSRIGLDAKKLADNSRVAGDKARPPLFEVSTRSLPRSLR